MAEESQKFISIDQTAKLLGVTYHTIWMWLTQKIIPSYRIGMVIRIDREELIEGFKSGKFQEIEKRTKKRILENLNNNPESGAASSPPFASPPSGENKKEE